MRQPRGEVRFLSADDAEELVKALIVEGYAVEVRLVSDDSAPCRVDVEPLDDEVVALVDVYGGWLPDDMGGSESRTRPLM